MLEQGKPQAKTDPSHLWTKRHGWIVCQLCGCDIYNSLAAKPCITSSNVTAFPEHKAR